MRVLVVGPRNLENAQQLLAEARQESGYAITEIVTGNITNFEDEVFKYCTEKKLHIRLCFASKSCWGDQETAIRKRNEHMVETSDALIAIWDGQDDEVRQMVEAMRRKKDIRVFVKFFVMAESA